MIGQFSTTFLHVKESPIGVTNKIFHFKGSIFIQESFAYAVETNECVAPESNNVHARLPNKGMVPVTTLAFFSFSSSSALPGVREYTRA
jgi:hypothetical protein